MSAGEADSAVSAGPVTDVVPPSVAAIDWSKRPRSVYWVSDGAAAPHIAMIDQRNLPATFGVTAHHSVKEVAHSIRIMLVRGAPAIGAAGAFAMALAAQQSTAASSSALLLELANAKAALDEARPTAVNLSWATARLYTLAELLVQHAQSPAEIVRSLIAEAQSLADDDVRINCAIGAFGASLLPTNANVIHHCNTGCLATVDFGTALGVIYSAHHAARGIHVWVDETRPRLQGAKLTCWELKREGVPHRLIVDGASGSLMAAGKVDAVVFGADRVTANGDCANKIGTYNLAIVSKHHGVPVYACVPTPTIDLSMRDGSLIPIEERRDDEITQINGVDIAPAGTRTFNPAFDVTSNALITAIITEEGICYPPFETSLKDAKDRAEKRVRDDWNVRLQKYLQQNNK